MSGKAVRETLGFLAVVASLVFVGVEIQQNTTVARAQARQALADASTVFNLALTDPALNRQRWELWSLGPDDEVDCLGVHAEICSFVFGLLRHHENVFLQVREGLIDQGALDSYGWRNNGFYSAPFFAEYWSERAGSYHPAFVAAFEAEYDLAS